MNRGFTLIEILVYLGLYAIIIGGSFAAAFYLIESAAHQETKASVQQEGGYLMGKIDWVLANTSTVAAPGRGEQGNVLTVARFDGSSASLENVNGSLMFSEDGAAPVVLNNIRVRLGDGAIFSRIEADESGTPESIAATFTVYASTTSGRAFSQTFSTVKYLRR